MKKLFFIIAIATGLCTVTKAQELKFGHFDSQSFIEKLPETQKMKNTIEEETKKIENQLTILQEDFNKMQQDFQSKLNTMTDEQKAEKYSELQETNQKIQNFVQLSQLQLEQKQQELMMPIVQKVQNAINEVGDENGFIYIIESKAGLILHQSPKSIDITPFMKKKFSMN